MKYKFLILWFFLLNISSVFSQERDLEIPKIPLTNYYSPSDYNGGIQNWSFDLDTSNVLFVSNNFGLMEFDGARWINHDVPITTKLRSVHIANDNNIYIGGQGQIGYFSKEKHGYKFYSFLDMLPKENKSIEEVWKIVELDEAIYFNTSNRLIRWNDEKIEEIELKHQIQRIFKIDSTLLVQFANEGLFQYDNDHFIPLTEASELGEIISILPQGKRLICFTTDGRIYVLSNNKMTQITSSIDQALRSATINVVTQLSNGNIAIGTQNEGLFILDPALQLKTHLTRNKGLNDRTVLALMEDHFKNLWVGLNNGINYLELNSPLSLINEEVGLEGTGYAAKLFNNKIYLGTNNGLFFKPISSSNNEKYELIKGSEGQVYNLSSIKDELILNHHRGAFLVKKNRLEQIHDIGSWKMMPTHLSNKYIGGNYNGINIFEKNENKWIEIGKVNNLNISSRVLALQNDSTIWMTHGYKGAYLIELDETLTTTKNVSFFGLNEGFPSNVLINVYDLGENLVFTGETGVFNYDNESNYFVQNSFLSDWIGDGHISNITSQKNGDIYFIVNRELGYLNQKSFGNYAKELSVFKRINKLLSDDLENITIIDHQNVLIGAKEGFVHFDPTESFELQENFVTYIKSIEIDFSNDSTTHILGGYFNDAAFQDANSIKFQFSAPYFDGVNDLRYSHRLKGFDSKWSMWSSESAKEYTNLPAGDYEFEVKARNIYGSESKVSKAHFKILPKWYASNIAYAIYAFLILLSFGLSSLIQNKIYRRKKEEIVLSKEEAIKNKDEELTQVSRQSEEQIESLKNEKLKSEIKHKDRELASTTMHLLNKNEFVQGVRKRLESLIASEANSKDELKKILKTIDRNLTEDDSWDQFAFHFDQVHGDFLKKLSEDEIKLTGQETKLAAYLRMNMSSKEIANLMNISIRGVELARYRLRKKLNLDRSVNLVEHLMEI